MENPEQIPTNRKETRELYNKTFELEISEPTPDPEKKETAVLIAPGGGGQHSRLEIAWGRYSDHVFVAGTRQDPEYSGSDMLEHLTKHTKGSSDNEFVYNPEEGRTDIPSFLSFKVSAAHTREQTEWFVEKINLNKT